NDKKERDISSITMVRDLRPQMQEIQARYPGAVIQLVQEPPGPPVRATVLAEVYGEDLQKLREIPARISEELKNTYDMAEVHDSEVADVRRYSIVVDKEKAALSGVTSAAVALAIRRLVDGENLGRLHLPGEKQAVPIRLHIPRRYQIDPVLLSTVFVTNRDGKKVPLSELTQTTLSLEDRPILHKDYERVTYIGGELTHTAPVYAVLDLDKRLDNMDLGNGQHLTTGNLKLGNKSNKRGRYPFIGLPCAL
ncbi:MAG: acriflavin resistance protein, partial [Piscirickettsiaceae bacterium]